MKYMISRIKQRSWLCVGALGCVLAVPDLGCSHILGVSGEYGDEPQNPPIVLNDDPRVNSPSDAGLSDRGAGHNEADDVSRGEPADDPTADAQPPAVPDSGDTTRDGQLDDEPSTPPHPMPIHRYSFTSMIKVNLETQVPDLVGTANAVFVGPLLAAQGLGIVNLDHQYMQLPQGMISSLSSVTIMAWITWRGVAEEERVFDFGYAEDLLANDNNTSYLALATEGKSDKGPFAALTKAGPDAQISIEGTDDFPRGTEQLVTVVVDEARSKLRLYMNQNEVESKAITTKLSEIRDERNYLGKAQKVGTHDFKGSFNEFRIYDKALTASQIAELAKLGPDTL